MSKKEDKLELAFSFAASEFLDEELEGIQERFGNIDFITKGKVIKIERTAQTPHNYQYWCAKDAINELNTLLHKDDIKIEVILQSKEEVELLKDIFDNTTANEFHSLIKNRGSKCKDVDAMLIMELSYSMHNSLKLI